jgi:hypothetical protein
LYKCPTSGASCNVNRRLGIGAKETELATTQAYREEGQYSTKCPFLGFRAETIQFFIYHQIVRRRVMDNLFRINEKKYYDPL